jgi:hypothetical protein
MAGRRPRNRFTDLLTRLVRVPKHEIDDQERLYQQARQTEPPAKPGEIVAPINITDTIRTGSARPR